MTAFVSKDSQRWYFIPCIGNAFFIESAADTNAVIQVPVGSMTKLTPTSCTARQALTNHTGALFTLSGSYLMYYLMLFQNITSRIIMFQQHFSLAAAPSQALENQSPGTVVLNNLDGRLTQVWSRHLPKPSATEGPPADGGALPTDSGAPQSTPLVVDLPDTVGNSPSMYEFRGCKFLPSNRS